MASVSRETMEKTTSKPVGGHSTFLNGYPLAGSYRFGELQPHFVQEVVPDDDIEISSAFRLDSYTLSQRLMQDLFISHGYYFVPLPALLPFNYEKFITNPVIGEDINPELVGLSYDFNKLKVVFDNVSRLVDSSPSLDSKILWIVRYFILYDMIFGCGGLPATLGYKFISSSVQSNFENLFQSLSFAWTNAAAHAYVSVGQNNVSIEYFRDLVQILRDDFSVSFSIDCNDPTGLEDSFVTLFHENFGDGPGLVNVPDFGRRINVARILSYQIVCAHFFTNDKVDYIYSAELYRQNVHSAWLNGSFVRSLTPDTSRFVLNGEKYDYDYLSGFCFDFRSSSDANVVESDLQYLRLLFGFNRSLRHVDYFTGSRTRPLAVGDVGVRSNNGMVDVVDIIQTSWYSKFLNQVNRTGRRLSNYMKALFPSSAISQDWHEPIWLGDTTDKVTSSEVDNTSSNTSMRNGVSATLTSNAKNYGFRYKNSQYYGVIIGLTYFDVERFYPEVVERQNYHVDRFDMFNPFLQFNGDQEVYMNELRGSASHVGEGEPGFGYQSRYLEYKQRVPQAFGAFVCDPITSKSIFLADVDKTSFGDYETFHISPSYIRSSPLEFDRFYTSLTGISLSLYYHFQIIHWNRVKSVRPMVFNPQLG